MSNPVLDAARDKRARLQSKLDLLLVEPTTESRSLTDGEVAEFEELAAKITKLDGQIDMLAAEESRKAVATAAVAEIGPHARNGFEFEATKCDGAWRWKALDEVKPMTPAEAAVAIMQYYPVEARARGVWGEVTLNCIKTEHNRLTGCEVASESPQGLGFADAALTLAKLSVDNPKLSLGQGVVREPVQFAFSLDPPAIRPNPLVPLHVRSAPHWIKLPTTDDISRVYPDDAARHKASGQAVLSCEVLDNGRLAKCKAEDSRPLRSFGEAALRLAKLFQLGGCVEDGEPSSCSGSVKLPIQFSIAR